jgi:hypothetical protein
VRVRKQDPDHRYFVIVPHLVAAMCENTYQLALWTMVKMIAGEDGECMLCTEDLAALAMMSEGKCSQARKALLRLGLLQGELRRDPGYPQPVWHLRVPDLWKANVTWRERHHSLRGRIKAKQKQRQARRGQPSGSETVPPEDAKEPSPGEAEPSPGEAEPSPYEGLPPKEPSSGEEGVSPGEGGLTPGEEGVSPGETKKNHKGELDQEPRGKRDPDLREIWRRALPELEMQMTRNTFARWIRPLETGDMTRRPDGTLVAVLCCPSTYEQEWCAGRLDAPIRRTVSGIAGEDVEVMYVVGKHRG